MKGKVLILLCCLYTYAHVRYHIGKGIPLSEWLFILNKSIAWTGGILLGLSLFKYEGKNIRNSLGSTGYLFATIHLILDIILMSPEHYPSFYTLGQLNTHAYITITLGATSFICFSTAFIGSISKNHKYLLRFGRIGILISILHVTMIGKKGWFTPNSWPFHMPPITLLFVLTIVSILLIDIRKRLKR
jgi:hypothetical protein